jgi:hypothetical protein
MKKSKQEITRLEKMLGKCFFQIISIWAVSLLLVLVQSMRVENYEKIHANDQTQNMREYGFC